MDDCTPIEHALLQLIYATARYNAAGNHAAAAETAKATNIIKAVIKEHGCQRHLQTPDTTRRSHPAPGSEQ